MRTVLSFVLLLSACASSPPPPPTPSSITVPSDTAGGAAPATAQGPAPSTNPGTAPPVAPTTGAIPVPPSTPTSSATPSSLVGATTLDAPEISRSVGVRGGVVVLWPRVAPRSDDPNVRAVASAIQQRLRTLVERSLPGRPIDLRPEPERVCPRQGCAAMTVGASLFHTPRGGCSVVAIVSGAGASPQRLVPWVGNVTLRETIVPFREPPEGRMQVVDMALCNNVVNELPRNEEAVTRAIREAAPPN